MERGPLKLGEDQRASDNKQVLDWGPHRVSAFSPPESRVGIKVGAPLPTSHSCGQSTSAGHPNRGRLCAQLGWCSTDQVGRGQQGICQPKS